MRLVTELYTISQTFPSTEVYGLTNQVRHYSVSIPSNIAEEYGKHSIGDYKRFLRIALGSLFELQTQVEIAFNLNYIPKEIFEAFYERTKELDRMLLSRINKIK